MKTMKYKGFSAQIMETARLKGNRVYGLPPGNPLDVYHADEFINYPENWMKGPGVFVVPVLPNTGLWFDWTTNSPLNTAIVPTVKGCNPVTGLKTSGFHLERYEKKCPKHNIDFMGERFCEKCGYKWPERNYVSMHPLWWDGFRAEDGTVRQFFFTEESMRDVASALIGKKNTVPAFGFAFYSPKERRQEHVVTRSISNSGQQIYNTGSGKLSYCCEDSFVTSSADMELGFKGLLSTPGTLGKTKGSLSSDKIVGSNVAPCSGGPSASNGESSADGVNVFYTNTGAVDYESPMGGKGFSKKKSGGSGKKCAPSGFRFIETRKKNLSLQEKPATVHTSFQEKPAPVKEVAVGAGARIRQDLNVDTYPLDSWKEKPDAAVTLYFVFHEKLEELKSKGMRDLKGHPEGMLSDVPVG